MRVLLSEDEVTIAVTLGDALAAAGHEVLAAADTASAIALLESKNPEIVVTDMRMPGAGGMAVLQRSVEIDRARPVIVITGYASIDQAVEAMRLGAANYVQKPFRNEAIVNMIETFARVRALETENADLRRQIARDLSFAGIIGASKAMMEVFDRVRTVAPTDETILI
jgi:DNA-binding NtrC family response regulator